MGSLRVFLPFAAGYFLSYLFRVVNAVIAPNLIADLSISPSILGALTSTYFITFAFFQLPLGILLDRYGPRRVESLLLLAAALGAVVFSMSHSVTGLIIGRGLIGFGVSACLMAAFKAYTLWFDRSKWPVIYGFQMAAGGFGALAATSPVEAALGVTTWRIIFLILAALTLLVAGAIFLFVPEKEQPSQGESFAAQISGITEVFTDPTFLRLAPLATLSQASFLAIQGLWAGPWLNHVSGLDRATTAKVLFAIASSMVAGFILIGFIAERLHRLDMKVTTTSVIAMALFMVIQGILVFTPSQQPFLTWMAFGFLGTSGIVAYSGLSQHFPARLSGRVTTSLNLLVFVTAFLAQWYIGIVIDYISAKLNTTFSPVGFKVGFGSLLLLEFVCLLWYMFPRKPSVAKIP